MPSTIEGSGNGLLCDESIQTGELARLFSGDAILREGELSEEELSAVWYSTKPGREHFD
jgi:hypothetical protein